MNRLRRDSEHGLAALELTLCIGMMLGFVALLAPLPFAMREKLRLERAAGQAARFATSTPDRPRPGVTTGGRRPSMLDTQNEAVAAFTATGATPTFTASEVSVYTLSGTTKVPASPSTTRPGTPIYVELNQSVDLGLFGGVMSALGVLPDKTITLTATAVGREE